MRKNFTICQIIIIFLLISSNVFAFDFDTKGTEFWLTFPPNYHNNKISTDDFYRLGDSIYIFITSDIPTNGNIEYTNLSGNLFNKSFTITDPSQIYIFKLCYLDYELLGFNDSGDLFGRNHCETIKKQYFHITSDDEVTVYAHSQSNKTSDACIVLPGDILGKDYFVMAYKSDGVINSITGNLTGSSTPSQFVVLGTADNTRVTILPSTETQFNGMNVQNITLNKGEAYLVQANIERTKLNLDLSGTEIHSDKPIAVFAGHQRANVPIITRNSPSRDFLFEQMPPIETWGKNALLVPYVQPSNITQFGTDIFRILSAYDNTQVFINGELITSLNKGELYENQLLQPAHIEASSPVLVAQFKKTSDYGSGTILGDPFEMLIPPVEQFMYSYRVINTQAHEYYRDWYGSPIYRKVYGEQYITIVATDSSFASVFLDGNPVQLSNFKPIPTSNYYYANMKVSDGVHLISCNEKIGVYVYGYGAANSYGYVGGMYLRSVDFLPPLITGIDSCYSVSGMVYDSALTDSKLATIQSPFESQVNVNVKIENFTPYKKNVSFQAKLQNFYEDGEFEIQAIDSIGLNSRNKYEIPGFTLSVKGFHNGTILPIHDKIYRIGKEFCYPVIIENYGNHIQNINSLILKNNVDFKIVYKTPTMINPGQTDTAFICFGSAVDTIFIDTLAIVSECGIRKIQAFNVLFRSDTSMPVVNTVLDPCNKEANLSVSDSAIIDFGLESVEVLENVNCSVTIDNYLPKYSTLKIKVINPYKDAIYHFIAKDSAGFIIDFIDTIQGFTIEFPELQSNANNLEFEGTEVGFLSCKTILILNAGLLPITFNHNVFLNKNIIFSLPVSQLPLTINPGVSEKVKICFSPVTVNPGIQYDTLFFEFNCIKMGVNIFGVSKAQVAVSGDEINNCNIPIKITINEIPGTNFLAQNYPNPVAENTIIRFGNADKGLVSLKVYDLMGTLRLIAFSEVLNQGIYNVQINSNALEQGVYIYNLITNGCILSKTMVIRK